MLWCFQRIHRLFLWIFKILKRRLKSWLFLARVLDMKYSSLVRFRNSHAGYSNRDRKWCPCIIALLSSNITVANVSPVFSFTCVLEPKRRNELDLHFYSAPPPSSPPPPPPSSSCSLLTPSLLSCLSSCGNRTTLGRRGCWSKSTWRPTFGKEAEAVQQASEGVSILSPTQCWGNITFQKTPIKSACPRPSGVSYKHINR